MIQADVLRQLEQRMAVLVDVFLDESDPSSWPDNSNQENRGNRVWLKKSAGATANLILRIHQIMEIERRVNSPLPVDPEHQDDEAPDTVTMAEQAMAEANKIIRSAAGTRFGKRDGK